MRQIDASGPRSGEDILWESCEADKDTIEMSGDGVAVTTVGRDDFFNDPFFKDWWADFNGPLDSGKESDKQISGGGE